MVLGGDNRLAGTEERRKHEGHVAVRMIYRWRNTVLLSKITCSEGVSPWSTMGSSAKLMLLEPGTSAGRAACPSGADRMQEESSVSSVSRG